jgi:hypothetical protein
MGNQQNAHARNASPCRHFLTCFISIFGFVVSEVSFEWWSHSVIELRFRPNRPESFRRRIFLTFSQRPTKLTFRPLWMIFLILYIDLTLRKCNWGKARLDLRRIYTASGRKRVIELVGISLFWKKLRSGGKPRASFSSELYICPSVFSILFLLIYLFFCYVNRAVQSFGTQRKQGFGILQMFHCCRMMIGCGQSQNLSRC